MNKGASKKLDRRVQPGESEPRLVEGFNHWCCDNYIIELPLGGSCSDARREVKSYDTLSRYVSVGLQTPVEAASGHSDYYLW